MCTRSKWSSQLKTPCLEDLFFYEQGLVVNIISSHADIEALKKNSYDVRLDCDYEKSIFLSGTSRASRSYSLDNCVVPLIIELVVSIAFFSFYLHYQVIYSMLARDAILQVSFQNEGSLKLE